MSSSVGSLIRSLQGRLVVALAVLVCSWSAVAAEGEKLTPPEAQAKTEAEMKPYTQPIPGTDATFDMVPIKGGAFLMGSPETESGRQKDEGPQHQVQVEPFWMGKHEVTWDEYDIWSFNLDIQRRQFTGEEPTAYDEKADAVTRPTKPYTDMTFNMGHDGFPAICMTQMAAKMYCEWLSAKTGHYYRLPTEAEWEYACRAGTATPYSFGDDPGTLNEYAWSAENSEEGYSKVGQKKPNPWGLYDMHGSVAEWCLDQYYPEFYARTVKQGDIAKSPLAVGSERYPHVVRGGSWQDGPEVLRSAARVFSHPDWKMQDPQIPQSVWYFTDAKHVGFRLVRPLKEPTEGEKIELRLKPLPEDLIRR